MYHNGVWSFETAKNGRSFRADGYGGLLTNNVAEALARALMVEAMFRLEAAGFPVVLTVHDEIVCERRPEPIKNELLDRFQAIMSETPEWAGEHGFKIPIAVDAWAGSRYHK